MNRLLSLISLLLLTTGSLAAQTLPERYAQYGELIVVKLDSAPFPHPARAKGHIYHQDVYTAEKNYSDNSVAIFVPKGFRPTERVDYVVHFYGWRHRIETTLDEYKLIPQFVASGRNAILIVPQGPYMAADSFEGKLEDTNGFKRFMGDVVSTLQSRGIITSGLIGKIILTGHSGGFEPVSSIVARGGLSGNVKEVWIFDALYAGTENFLAWYKEYPKRRFIDIYTLHGGTKEESEGFMATMKASKPPIPFLSKNEKDITHADLKDNRVVFIFSELPHDVMVYGRDQYRDFLKTSSLSSIKAFTSPKETAR